MRIPSPVLIACLTLIMFTTVQAQNTPAASAPSSVETRAYEINRLLALPEFNPVTFGDPPTTQPAPKQREQLVSDLIDAIKKQIAPASWLERGGLGSIQRKEDQLFITQTRGNHDALSSLLEKHNIQITVETRFIEGMDLDNVKWIKRGEAEVSPDPVDDAQVALLLKAAQANNDTTTVTAPRLTMFNGQRAYVTMSTGFAYISDIKIQPDGSLEPIVSQAQSGILLDCTADVTPGNDSISMRLHPNLSQLLKIYSSPWPAPPATQQATVQVPVISKAEFDQTFDIPSGKTLVIRLNPKITPLDPNFLPQRPTLVLIHPTIVTPKGQQP